MIRFFENGAILAYSAGASYFNFWKGTSAHWWQKFTRSCADVEPKELAKIQTTISPILQQMSHWNLSFYTSEAEGTTIFPLGEEPVSILTAFLGKGEIHISPTFFKLDNRIQNYVLKHAMGHLHHQHIAKYHLAHAALVFSIPCSLRFYFNRSFFRFADVFLIVGVTTMVRSFFDSCFLLSTEIKADQFAATYCTNEELKGALIYAKATQSPGKTQFFEQRLQDRNIQFTPSEDEISRARNILTRTVNVASQLDLR